MIDPIRARATAWLWSVSSRPIISSTSSRSRGEPWSSAFGNRIRIAINQQLAEEGDAIRDGDEVAFFPPVTGG